MAADPKPMLQPPTGRRWLVFALACSTSWFLYLHRYTWNVIRPLLQDEYGFSNTEMEALFTATFYLSYALGQIPSGITCDFFGAHIFLTIIILAWSLVLLLFGFVKPPWALGALRFGFGAAQAGCYPALGQVKRTWFPRSSRTLVQGVVASFFGRGGGAMASIIMATLLIGQFGLSWRWALAVMSLAGVLFSLVFYLLYRNSPAEDPQVNEAERALIQEGEPPGDEGPRVLPFGRAMRNPSLAMLVVQQFANAGADIVYTVVIGSYFLSKGISVTAMGLLVSMPLLGGAVGGIAGGYLNDYLIRATGSQRWGRSLVAISGKTLAAVVLLLTVWQSNALAVGLDALFADLLSDYSIQSNALAAGIGLLIVKFFSDWSQPTVWGACTDIGGRYSATVFSINNTSGNVGALVLPLVIGPLLDLYTRVVNIGGMEFKLTNYGPMFVLVAGLYLFNAACWLFIDCTKSVATENA